MSGSTLVVLGATAVVALLGHQPSKEDLKSGVVSVEIVSDTGDGHAARCKAGGLDPRTILVAGKAVFHCVGQQLLTHDDEEKNTAFEKTLVHVSAGQAIRWFSKSAKFRVAQIRLHEPVVKGAPASPFVDPTWQMKEFATEVTTPRIRDENPNVVQRYKVSFFIENEKNLVDPDVVCSM